MTLRLLPGRRPRAAAEELRHQETAVGNLRTAGHLGQEQHRAYLMWAIEAERMLRNHFTSDSVSSVIFTQRYWALQMSSPDNSELAKSLVDAEIKEQGERLLREKALLDEGQTRWMWGRLLVLDTSALIHGPRLWDWDPAADLGLHDNPVQIVIPILVLDELDQLKEHTKEHTRNRARKTLKWLSEHLGSHDHIVIREGHIADKSDGSVARGDVHVDILLDEPGHIRLAIADDEIVDRAAAIASGSGRDVTLVTNDVSQAYRARFAGLDVSTVAEPTYDLDIQEAAKEAAKVEKLRKDAARRTAQEAQKGARQAGEQRSASSDPAPEPEANHRVD